MKHSTDRGFFMKERLYCFVTSQLLCVVESRVFRRPLRLCCAQPPPCKSRRSGRCRYLYSENFGPRRCPATMGCSASRIAVGRGGHGASMFTVGYGRPLATTADQGDAAGVTREGHGAARLQWGVALPGLPWCAALPVCSVARSPPCKSRRPGRCRDNGKGGARRFLAHHGTCPPPGEN
jgi:hypothetical protein